MGSGLGSDFGAGLGFRLMKTNWIENKNKIRWPVLDPIWDQVEGQAGGQIWGQIWDRVRIRIGIQVKEETNEN